MNLKQFLARGWPTRLAFHIGKIIPPGMAYWLARRCARLAVRLKSDIYHTARANLRHVTPDASEAALDAAVERLFEQALRGYYELFHNVGRGVVAAEDFAPPVYISPELRGYIDAALADGRGLFILGSHMSNFDLGGIALSQYIPVQVQVLSVAEPPPGFEFFNQLREKGDGIVTPVSPEVLRDAMRRLREGGVVITGVDRPGDDGDEPVTFFGETAHLPTGYMRIPLRTDCLMMTVAFVYREGAYWIIGNPPLEVERTGDRHQDVIHNVQRILAQIEDLIRVAPDQWMMFVPVWPA